MKAGFIAIVGRPNVGKSTLLNRILGEKVAIVSPRAQTTRHRIKGILTRKDAQLVFVDTPGIHKPHHLLGENLVKAAEEALGDSDVRLFLVDGSEKAGKGDEWIAELLKGKKTTLLVVNKSDRPGAATAEILASYRALGFEEVIPVSAKTGKGLDSLIEKIVKLLPEGQPFYDEEEWTDQTERTLGAELIREQALHLLGEELPHAIAVRIDEWKEQPTITVIRAHLFVERDSQKGIVIGERGKMIKEIGTRARLAIEEMSGQKVHLELQVSVLKNWRKEANVLKRLGYAVD